LQRRFRNKTRLIFKELQNQNLFEDKCYTKQIIEEEINTYNQYCKFDKDSDLDKHQEKDTLIFENSEKSNSVSKGLIKKPMELEEWQKSFVDFVYSSFLEDHRDINWIIVSCEWLNVLQIVKHIGYTNDQTKNDWVIIKDPENYESVAKIIMGKKDNEYINIIFLLTKENHDLHTYIKEISNGILFYQSEPIFFKEPFILVFSKFVPIVYSEQTLKNYTFVKKITEEYQITDSSFILEESFI
jgi:hypothetical protein